LTAIAAMLAAAALATGHPASRAPTACKGTISGAVQASFDCVATVRPVGDGKLVFVVDGKAPIADVPSYAPGGFELPQAPRATRYTLDTLGMGRASVAARGGTLFTATKTSGQRGEVTLTFTSVKKRPDGAYDVRGRYRARLLPAGHGKQGEVVVEATF
jgi:hypothetical protein